MRRTAIVSLVAILCQVQLTESVKCDGTDDDQCGLTLNQDCKVLAEASNNYSKDLYNGTACQDYGMSVHCRCYDQKCGSTIWSIRRQFEAFFERFFILTGLPHRIANCRNTSNLYKIGHINEIKSQYPYFEANQCRVQIFLKDGVCSSSQSCFLNTRLSVPKSEYSPKEGVKLYCQGRVEKADCTSNVSSFPQLRNLPQIADPKLNKCMMELTEKWAVTKTVPKIDYNYECFGDHVGRLDGPKVCALLLRKHHDGSCELEQQSRSILGFVASKCIDEGTDVFCYCLGNNCNANESNFEFNKFFENTHHGAKSCMKMITHRVMSDKHVRKIGANSYECTGDDNQFWKDGNTICGVMISMDGGVCHLKQISRSVHVNDQKVPDCQNENGNLFCFCLGDNCNQDYQSFFGLASFMAAEKFYMKEYANTGKVPQLEECRKQADSHTGRLVQNVICGFGFDLVSYPNCDMVKDVCFVSYAPGVPGCWQSGSAVRCFCGGMGCYENTTTIMETFGVFFANSENHNHETKRCYMALIATTTVTTPSTTEQLTSIAETTMESTTESKTAMESTTESTIDTSTETDVMSKATNRQNEAAADSYWPLIIGLVSFFVFVTVVAIIGCCVWNRKIKKKKLEMVVEVAPKPLIAPIQKPSIGAACATGNATEQVYASRKIPTPKEPMRETRVQIAHETVGVESSTSKIPTETDSDLLTATTGDSGADATLPLSESSQDLTGTGSTSGTY